MKNNNKVASVILGLICTAIAVSLFMVYSYHREIIAAIADVRLAFIAAYTLPWLPLLVGITLVFIAFQTIVANFTRYNPVKLILALTEDLWNPTR